MNPTNSTVDDSGHRFVETSDDWKKLCQPLPSFKEVWWPDYATTVINDTINGQPVVIQLWKGWCQQCLGLSTMPGGIGAEVGIYRRIQGQDLPDPGDLDGLPDEYTSRILDGAQDQGDDGLWWPYPELGATITFDFIHPTTGDIFFSAGPEKTYWLNRWMNQMDYDRWKADPASKAPNWAWDFWLRYTINGKTYPVWKDHN